MSAVTTQTPSINSNNDAKDSNNDKKEEVTVSITSTTPGQQRGNSIDYAAEITAAVLYMLSAVCLLLLNKGIMRAYPFTFSVILFQNGVTILVVGICILYQARSSGRLPNGFTWDGFIKFTPITCWFVLTLVTGLEVFKYISVITFVALRYVTCILSYLGDLFILNRPYHSEIVPSLAIITIGAGVYASSDLEFSFWGYFYLLLNILSMSAFSIWVKYADNQKDYSVLTMSLFNNLQSMIPLLIGAFVVGELPNNAINALSGLTNGQVWLVVISGLAGFFISTTGFYAQKLFSATAWTLQSNLNKIPTLVLSYLIFHDKLSLGTILGATILMIGGFMYSYTSAVIREREHAQRYQRLSQEDDSDQTKKN